MKTLLTVAIATQLFIPMAMVVLIAALAGSEDDRAIQMAAYSTRCAQWGGDTGPDVTLTDAQLDRAATIYAAAQEVGMGSRAAVIAIATAMQESALGADEAAMAGPNADGDYGLFQQRTLVGWYANGATQDENIRILTDDHTQARNFLLGHDALDGSHIPGLADIDDWHRLPLTEAAQAVQRSAFPGAYAQWEPLATSVVNLFEDQPAGLVLCGAGEWVTDCPPTGLASEQGQTPDALLVMRCITAGWPQITSLLGVRPGDPRDHGTGRAVDVMIPDYLQASGIILGDEIAAWAREHATELGITYIIWRERIWSQRRDHEGWRSCADACYTGADDSAAHRDHIHISVHGHAATGLTTVGDGPARPGGEAVLPLEPGSYRLTARFGQQGRSWSSGRHTGLDFAAPTGRTLYAIRDGTISTATRAGGAYGYLTKLETTDGTVLYYAHQSRIDVTPGQSVAAGTPIGLVGNTGNSHGPHLHLEVRRNGTPIDPHTWLIQQGLEP